MSQSAQVTGCDGALCAHPTITNMAAANTSNACRRRAEMSTRCPLTARVCLKRPTGCRQSHTAAVVLATSPIVLVVGIEDVPSEGSVAAVKYVLMFVETEEFASELEAMGHGERERAYARVSQWFADHADKIRGGNKLNRPRRRRRCGWTAASRSSPTGRSSRARRSSAATPRSRSPTSTRRCGWSRPGRAARSSRSGRWHRAM